MILSKVKVKNYRNFVDEEVNFLNQSIIIGPNDVGKTNLIMAIRLLLDRNLSYNDLEPQEKDFNIFTNEDEITIILEFSEINITNDSYIYAVLGTDIENEKMYLMYKGEKYGDEKFKFFISAKENEDSFHEISRHKYLKVINCVYLDSTRQLKQLSRRSKINMINSYKQVRENEEIENDNIILNNIENDVNELNKKVESISYINKSTDFIKKELQAMSSSNDNIDIKFSSYNDADDIIDNVELITLLNGKNVSIGGDGRNNQIYMSMWIKESEDKYDIEKQFVVYIIEEPESHLHFPLQAMTIKQIMKKISSQLITTTHSPQIVLEFNPSSIIKLSFDKDKRTIITNNGCSKKLENELVSFGYRYNLITGSIFYSSGVFLVEGVSELLLFKFITKKVGIDLEKYNILIIQVDGVAFRPYIHLLNGLKINYAIRTDNDIIGNSNGNTYYCSGINRLIDYHNELKADDEKISNEQFLSLPSKELDATTFELFKNYRTIFENEGLFLSDIDLETDLSNMEFLSDYIISNYKNKEEFVKYLKKSKGQNMYYLIRELAEIKITKEDVKHFLKPLLWLIDNVDGNHNE